MRTLLTALAVVVMLCAAASSLAQRPARRGRPGQDQIRKGEIAKEGKTAPDFQLKSLDGESEVKLSSFAGKKPVALFFGSYT